MAKRKRKASKTAKAAQTAKAPLPAPPPTKPTPKNKIAASPLTRNIEPYSAMKKKLHRRPEYSVWKPATNSLSASARSNGARFTLATAHVK